MSLLKDQVRWLNRGRLAIAALPDTLPLESAVIRDAIKTAQREEPVAVWDQDPTALAARQQHLEELLDRITSSIFEVGIVLSTAADLPPGGLNNRIDEAVQLLDDIVRGIYDAAFRDCGDVPGAARASAGPS